jgi:hypothetical protein
MCAGAMGCFSKRIKLTHYSKSQHFVLSLNLSLTFQKAGGLFQHPAKASRVLTVQQQPGHGRDSPQVRDNA